MNYREEKRDLFTVGNDYALAHCISSDFALGAGIALKFRQMGVADLLRTQYPNPLRRKSIGCCLITYLKDQDRYVFNLVTKERYFHKPTYANLRNSLLYLKISIRDMPIDKIAMPLIGCGLDGLEWGKVSEIIKETFADTDLEILICYL